MDNNANTNTTTGSNGSAACDGTTSSQNEQKQYFIMDAGKEKIKRMMSMGKPNQVIKEFSAENGLDIPAADTIYHLLHSLGYTKWSIHEAVLKATILSAENRIQRETLPPDQHIALLSQMKHYLDVPRLQHLPLMLLEKHPHLVPDDICKAVLQTPGLYQKCSTIVKRELWRRDHALFAEYMMPLIDCYARDDELLVMSREICSPSVKAHTTRRRARPALTQITSAIAADLQLYMLTLGMVRNRFRETNNPAFGTLRLDLVMSMHEKDVADITKNDVCHGLAWWLDACIMKQVMDDRRVLELQKYFDGIDSEDAPYGEIALILSSPYSRHILALYIFSILEDIAPNADVSTRYSDLTWPSLVLHIGLLAHDLLQQDHPKIPSVDRAVTKKFFRSLPSFILASQKHDRKLGGSYEQQQPMKRSPSKMAQLNHAGAFPTKDALYTKMGNPQPSADDVTILASSELARQVLYVFLLKRVTEFDIAMLNIWLPTIAEAFKKSLGLPDDAYDGVVTGNAQQQQQPQVALESRQNAFECDAFMQSLVFHIKEIKGLVSAVLNSAIQGLDLAGQGIKGASTDGIISQAIEAVPLLKLLDQYARVRHCTHEQVVLLLIESTLILSAEYTSSNNNNNSVSAAGTIDAPVAQTQPVPIYNKESAVYFVFVLIEHAAAKYAVDSDQLDRLNTMYQKLAAVSPPQAFEYRISSANCPNASRFLKG